MFNLTLKMKDALLFFLIVVSNKLICVVANNSRLDTFRINSISIGE